MSPLLRTFCLVGAALAGAAAAGPAMAAYPESTVTIVVGANPGASGDLMARLLAQKLAEKWKQPVVVENRSGASGLLAATEVRNAKPDGYTIYVSNDSPAINEVFQKNRPFEFLNTFAPVSLLAIIDFKLVVNPSLPVKTVPELVAYAKARPGKLNYASSGEYTPHHLMGELFVVMAGLDVVHVPFRGTAPAITATIGHQTDFAFSGFSGVDAQIASGKLRALGTTGKQRNAASPELPTIGESIRGYSANSWWAMWARREVPAAVRDEIGRQVRAIIAEPEVAQRLRATGLDPAGTGPGELLTLMNEEIALLRTLPIAAAAKESK